LSIFTSNLFQLRKFLKILLRIFFAIILLLLILYGLLHIPAVQTWVVKKVAKNLSKKLDTKVTVNKVDFRFFNKILLEGVMVEDRKHDTLLYAGTLSANVNDWFFFKDKISIENVGLDNAIVNMNRTDSVWNYQFIVDYFASPKKNGGSGGDINIDLKEVHFNNVHFNKLDRWVGQDMTAALGRFDVSMNYIDVKNKRIGIKSIYLENPLFSQNDYEGLKPPEANITKVLEKIPVISAFKWNNSGWEVRLEKLEIKNGTFKNDKYTEEPAYTDRFDGQHLQFSQINGTMKNLLFLHDTLSMNVNLSTKERSGLTIKKLSSNMRLTPELMEFKDLDLETDKSKLQNYYSMRYNAFREDFNSFINNVTLEANFKGSVLSSEDLAIFAPALKSWKRTFYLEGNVKGPLDNFTAKDMKISTGNSYLEGRIAMRGLPDINSTFIDFESKGLKTNYNDLVALVPQLKKVQQPAIAKLGNIFFKGNFTGFIRDFVAYGSFQSNLGALTADINMKVPDNGPPAYSGKVTSDNFDIGAFINNNTLGKVSLNLNLAGAGFNVAQLKAKVDGTISAIQFNGYNYKNININGDFEKKLFMGHLSIDDPNLSIPSFDGALNLSSKDVGFKFLADVKKANLKNLGLVPNNMSFSGLLDFNFTGNNIDNFLGTARITNARLLRDSSDLSFDSLTVRSEIIGGKKSLTLQTNEVDANITGDFKIMELPDAVKVLLARYYPTYIKAPAYFVKSTQNFDFSIKTRNADQYIRLLSPKLGGFNNATITGAFNLQNYDLKLNAAIPQFSFDGKEFNGVALTGTGTKDTLVADIAVDDVIINDSLHLPDSRLRITANNDLSLIKLNTSASKIFGDAELNASVQTLSDGVKIHFYPSSFVINNKKWQLDKDGELTLRRKFLDASEVKFFHNDQQIVLSTELDDVTDDTHLTADLTKINIEDFAPFLIKKPALKGILTGRATVRDIFGKSSIDFKGVADSFSLDGKYIGKLNLDASANTETGLVKYKVNTNEQDYVFDVNGTYNYKDTTGNSLAVSVNAGKLSLDILQPYLSTVFSEMKGIAVGNINISSGGKNLSIIGDARISGGAFRIAYTQVKYLFDNQMVHFGKDLIDIGTMQIRDTLGNPGTVSGKMHHEFFQNFSFENMKFSTDKMVLLNTTKKDNQQFYGNVIGRATMTLNGGIANMLMNIEGEPSPTDSSHVYLPLGSSKESNVIDYIDFIQFGSLMDVDVSTKETANLLVNLALTANPACKVDVILDEETGDIIKGEGNGLLNIRVGTKEPLSIRGRYDLTEGEYTFNFQTFLRRPFTLNRGSITWNGDPMLAIIDMDAEYLAKNVDVSSITINSNKDVRTQSDVTIVSHLSGNLTKPTISFEFRLPKESELNRDFYIVKRLADFKNDENEMNKQVASLLLFNQFVSQEQNFLSGGSTLSIATGTIGGVVSAWLTNLFNKELEKATKGFLSTYIDINPSLNSQQANQLQANIRAGLKVRLFKNVLLLIGGNLDYNNPVTQLYSKGVITPDISLEWILNKDGSIRVVAFNRTTIDFTTGQRRRSGVQLTYRKDVDRLSDIFRSKKKIAERDSIKYAPKK
jgi:hypothetical protein